MNRILVILLFFSVVSTVNSQTDRRLRYVELYKNCAINEMHNAGIPASITLAQGILESDCGDSYLATYANNHFGIKCHDWQGETAYQDDDKENECFRKYSSVDESYADHSEFLTSKQRYAELFKLDRTDYVGWAKGLKACGYATDPSYAQRLIDIIEDLNLHQYDLEGGGKSTEFASIIKESEVEEVNPYDELPHESTPTVRVKKDAFVIDLFPQHEVKYNNGVRYVEISKSDTFESIAVEFHLTVSELLSYNDMSSPEDISQTKYIYIRSKHNRAHVDCPTHEVRRGDTPWTIAHKYGIKLKKLCKYNGIASDEELSSGTVLNLRYAK